MASPRPAREKSMHFSIRIIKIYQFLCQEKQEYVLSKQLLRSGTSIGANLAESECAISKKDFAAKIYIALKECAETAYWLDLLYKTDYLPEEQYFSLHRDCIEMQKILTATTKTLAEKEVL